MGALELEQWEPSESRGSRWVLREAEGEVPSAYSPTYSISLIKELLL